MRQWVEIFILTSVTDVVWALYIQHVSALNAFAASFWASILIVLSGFSIILYTENHWLLIPAASGAFFGTYVVAHPNLKKIFSKRPRSP